MLNKEDAIDKITQMRIKAGPRHTYIFKCKHDSCKQTIRVRCDALKTATGFCKKHSHQKRPYESIYESLKNDHRKIQVDLTYKEFLEFTKIKQCYYCLDNIPWVPYGTEDGEFKSRAYYLDRKLNNGPYSKENCVVCCSRCNKFKSNLDEYEFIVLCNLIAENCLKRILDK